MARRIRWRSKCRCQRETKGVVADVTVYASHVIGVGPMRYAEEARTKLPNEQSCIPLSLCLFWLCKPIETSHSHGNPHSSYISNRDDLKKSARLYSEGSRDSPSQAKDAEAFHKNHLRRHNSLFCFVCYRTVIRR